MKFLIVDLANTFFRMRHVASRQASDWDKIGFAIHTSLASINKAWREQKGEHVVVCLEGRSWRKDFYKPYKANRVVDKSALTESEIELDQLFWQAFDDLKTFFETSSNVTVLQHKELEADDLIAGWIQNHPEDEHVIISSDTDFYQLLDRNVTQYNGVSDELHTLDGIYDRRGKRVMDKKTKEPKVIPDPKWILFEKCIRGDATDNIFSAYPGVRKKGTKNKTGLLEAFEDKDAKGFSWNNLMLQRWVDHNGEEHRVMDDYERNRVLVDLSAQPPEIRSKINETVNTRAEAKQVPMIGARFLKFCGKYDLIKLSENAQQYAELLSAAYDSRG